MMEREVILGMAVKVAMRRNDEKISCTRDGIDSGSEKK
jgi:hypothetical protein